MVAWIILVVLLAASSLLPFEIFVNLHPESRLVYIVGHESDRVYDKAIGRKFEELFFSRLVPELVEEFVIVLLSQCCLDDRVQVLLRLNPLDFIVVRAHLNVDELFARLQGPSELKVEAPGHEDDLNQDDVDHVRPAHARLKVELFGVVRHHSKVKWVLVALFY